MFVLTLRLNAENFLRMPTYGISARILSLVWSLAMETSTYAFGAMYRSGAINRVMFLVRYVVRLALMYPSCCGILAEFPMGFGTSEGQ